MGRLLENIGKSILRDNGIVTPDFKIAKNQEEAVVAADELGYPVVIKALVAVGKRGKAGAVKFAQNSDEVRKIAKEILSMTVHNFPVELLLIEKKVEISRELYVSITFDPLKMMPVVILTCEGGVEVEGIAKLEPEKVKKYHVNIREGLHLYKAKEMWSDLGLTGKSLMAAATILHKAYLIFEKYDATIIEINPLAVGPQGEVMPVAILMGIDDDALFRQPVLSKEVIEGSDRAWRPLTALEKEMIAVDKAGSYRGTARYTEMEGGNIGFLCGGGGGSLLMYDALCRYGGRPANYTEFGGNPTEDKVSGLVKGVLSKPGVKGFCMVTNITNNTQTDVCASGIIRAFTDLNVDRANFPIIVRLAGVNDEKASKLFSEAGIEYHGDDITMEDAARLMVDKIKKAYPEEES